MKVKFGYCQCGCGRRTRVAPQTCRAKKWIRGMPLRFCKGHNAKLERYAIGIRFTTHGRSLTPEYKSYSLAKGRCTNRNSDKWKYYGGAGVRFCFRDFSDFLSVLGLKPRGTTLGRYGDVGNYERGNCKWMTRREQLLARREKTAMKKAA